MDKNEYLELLQSDEKELKGYMDRARWHAKEVQRLDIENKKLKATLKHLKVHGEFIQDLLKNEGEYQND